MNLKTKELERYSRQIIIKDIGISGQKKIKNSKVLIVGLGGLGCATVGSPILAIKILFALTVVCPGVSKVVVATQI
mgnify:CR=1 FL=1